MILAAGAGLGVVFIVLMVAAVIAVAVFAHLAEERRRKELASWATSAGLTFRPGRDRRLEDRYPLFSCFRRGGDRYAHNAMIGSRSGRTVHAFDYHYTTTSTDSKGRRRTHHHHFSAVVVATGLPLKSLFLRPEGFFDRVTEFLGMDDIDFELAAFSRAFYVKAKDRRWAFDVLHQATMEHLLESPRYTIEMGGPWVVVRRDSRFSPQDFRGAIAVAEGILDRLPGYLLRELEGASA